MSTERKGVEIYVGLFLLIGLATIAAMAVMFGRVGQGFEKYYPITVEFPNAGGLVKDSDVLLAGARIGHVAEAPTLVGRSYTVAVKLNIRDDVKIPRKSTFLVGSSGLLGDRFVDVVPQGNFDPTDVVEPNARIEGTRASGLDDLTQKGGVVMDQLIDEIEEMKKLTVRLNEGLLSDQNMKNLEETFANLKTTSANFHESSKKLDPVLVGAQSAVDSAKGTMKTVEGAASDLKTAIADYRKTAQAATDTITSAKSLLKKASEGDGALGTLISDRQTAENLRLFLANLKRSGPIFYRDRPVPAPTPKPQPPRR